MENLTEQGKAQGAKPQHTQGKWRAEARSGNANLYFNEEITSCFANIQFHVGHDAEANAQRIAKAVNMHDELMENLKLAVQLMSIPDHMQEDHWFEQQDKLKDFIKQAEQK